MTYRRNLGHDAGVTEGAAYRGSPFSKRIQLEYRIAAGIKNGPANMSVFTIPKANALTDTSVRRTAPMA
jgi:hypothetical protein